MTDFITKLKALSSRYSKFNSLDASFKAHGVRGDRSGSQNRARKPLPSLLEKSRGKLGKLRPSPNSQQPGSSPDPKFNRSKPPLYRRWWAWGIVGLGFGTGGVAIALQTTVNTIQRELPDTAEALTYVRTGTLTIKASDGAVLQQLGPATRDKVALQNMPDYLPQAFIASEDEDFYEHGGVDYQAIARAFLKNLTAGEVVEGGSTITQQLARIVFLDQERSLGRKLNEALLAQKMERDLDKDQILEQYLNLVYLGSSAYGVADAAWIYFSKPVEQLTLSEVAMIAGMAPAPSVYSPLVNPDLAEQRRNIVLSRMVDVGYITAAERDAAVAEPIALKPSNPKNLNSQVPYFTSYVQQQLPNVVSPEQLEIGGLTVETTLNLEWQKEAEETVRYAIENYGPYEGFEQAALVSIDPRTGAIRALVGGDDFLESQFNRATQAQRQPGSTFKTFVYATSIAAGFSPHSSYVDGKLVVDGYEPQNYGRNYRGTVSIRDALVNSINIVAVKALIDVGFEPVIAMAERMGINSKLLPAYSLALGSSEVNLLELTSAYGTLANEGNHIAAHGITRVFDRFGNVIYQADFKPERAIDEGSAAVMSWMLTGVVDNGTGWEARLPDRPVAGKTGTSEKRRDLWFVGYIPQLVTGVWLGNDDSSPTYGASTTAARTWYDFMNTLTDEIPVEQFPETPPLVEWEGSIEAQPVKPKRISEYSAAESGGSDWESEDAYYDDYDSGYSGYDSGYDSGYSGSSSYDDYSEPAAAPAESSTASEPAPVAEESAPPPEEVPAPEPEPIVQEAPPEPIDSAPPPIIEETPPVVPDAAPVVVPTEAVPEPVAPPGSN